jgi:hypothetical protein
MYLIEPEGFTLTPNPLRVLSLKKYGFIDGFRLSSVRLASTTCDIVFLSSGRPTVDQMNKTKLYRGKLCYKENSSNYLKEMAEVHGNRTHLTGY